MEPAERTYFAGPEYSVALELVRELVDIVNRFSREYQQSA